MDLHTPHNYCAWYSWNYLKSTSYSKVFWISLYLFLFAINDNWDFHNNLEILRDKDRRGDILFFLHQM